MKKYNLLFLLILTVCALTTVKAQTQTTTNQPVEENSVKERRGDLLEKLGLTADQIQQFRRVNAEKRPQMRAAQQRLKAATRALDEAVYADAPDEAEVQNRIKEAQTAQAEVIKIRSLTEFAVRRILTAEQLTRFREARRRFEAAVEERRTIKKENRMSDTPGGDRLRNARRRVNSPPNN